MRSTLTIFVCPTRAHSVSICRTVASLATIDTRPFCIVRRTSAEAVEAATSEITAANRADFMVKKQYTPLSARSKRRLFPPEVVDDLREDVVDLVLRLVTDERSDARQVGNPARHVLESRFVRLVVWNELDRRLRTAEIADTFGERED